MLVAILGNPSAIYGVLTHPDIFGKAYFGNQQFTTSQLVFVQCATALQVHWDWAWTMQDFIIESCQRGLVVVGGGWWCKCEIKKIN
ncbi:MAG: hypothetical protein CL912_30780 [Deltaproteobacteria bacterium]|nr:hypothetical protein [Deltaproteobacteria bacterium]